MKFLGLRINRGSEPGVIGRPGELEFGYIENVEIRVDESIFEKKISFNKYFLVLNQIRT